MRLMAMSGGQTLSFPLRQGSTLIGRHSSCHICIPASSISRRHCQAYVDGTSVTLRDLGSSHGTFVNGQRIERVELRHGDVISLGGFELRYDSEGVAPTYAQGTRAAEDIVVTAQPAGMGGPQPPPTAPLGATGGPQPLGQEPPPPAPSDFPDKPSGEETPVDQSFMPAPYVPRQETVLAGGSDQPQLVVREGRWFLRDPRTGREVEIAPAGGGAGAVAVSPAALRRPNVRLLVTVVAIAAIVVLTFAVVILRGKPKPNVGPTTTNAEWIKIVDSGIDDLKSGAYAEARKKFDLASSKRRDLEPARLLTQYALLREAAGDDFRKLNKSEALRYLESIENTPCPSDRAIAFAREQRSWIDKESVGVAMFDGYMARYKGTDSEEVLLEVRAALQAIPQGLSVSAAAKEAVADINATIARGRLSRAEREKANRKWAEAVTHYNDALPFIENATTKAQVQKQIEDCRRYAGEHDMMSDAQRAISGKSYAAARITLQRIKEGVYFDAAQRLLKDIDRMEAAEAREALRQQARSLYESGAEPQVIEDFLTKHNLDEFRHTVEKAKRVIELLAAGKKAEDNRQYREAEAIYEQAVGVEGDANNDYNRRAKRMLEAIKARYGEIAAELAATGYRKLDKDPVGARKDFDEALKYDPNIQRAKDGLALLERRARLLYTEARGHVTSRPPKLAHARATFERARDCAPPGSNLYQLIVQELEKLPRE